MINYNLFLYHVYINQLFRALMYYCWLRNGQDTLGSRHEFKSKLPWRRRICQHKLRTRLSGSIAEPASNFFLSQLHHHFLVRQWLLMVSILFVYHRPGIPVASLTLVSLQGVLFFLLLRSRRRLLYDFYYYYCVVAWIKLIAYSPRQSSSPSPQSKLLSVAEGGNEFANPPQETIFYIRFCMAVLFRRR